MGNSRVKLKCFVREAVLCRTSVQNQARVINNCDDCKVVAKITLFFAGLALADMLLPGKAYRNALQLVDVYTCCHGSIWQRESVSDTETMGTFNREDGLSHKLGATVASYCIIVLCSPTSLLIVLVGTVWNLRGRRGGNRRSTKSNISEWFIVATVSSP